MAVSSRRELPRLLDCKGIQVELDVKRAAAEAIMRQLPKVVLPGLRKTYVKRDDVFQLVDASTVRE